MDAHHLVLDLNRRHGNALETNAMIENPKSSTSEEGQPLLTDEQQLPTGVIKLIEELSKRPDVQSVSFPYADERVWRLLVKEQVARAQRTGLHRQHAFSLSAGDEGLPFDPSDWGGFVHIPYEGACESDFFVKPPWHACLLSAANGDGDLTAAMFGKACRHVLLKGVFRELDSASRTVVEGWTLYTSKNAYVSCNPFLGRKFDPSERSTPNPAVD